MRAVLLVFACAISSKAARHVALLDFSTDDNSYRSMDAAAKITSLVQIALADEPNVQWVERSQLHVAKEEFALAEMQAGNGNAQSRSQLLAAFVVDDALPVPDELIKRYDSNRDGKLSAAELVELAKQLQRQRR